MLLATAATAAARIAAEEIKLAVFNKQIKAGNKTAEQVWMSEMEQGLPGIDATIEEEGKIKVEPDADELDDVRLSSTRTSDRKTAKEKRKMDAQKAKVCLPSTRYLFDWLMK